MDEIQHYEFILNPLKYDYTALEPYIDSETVFLHHDRHLKTYIDNLNDILKNYPSLQKFSTEELIKNPKFIPVDVRQKVLNNAGGVYNHNLYFEIMSNPAPTEPVGVLKEAIKKQYGSMDKLKSSLKEAGLSRFGSGYAWLTAVKSGGLKIISTLNQDCPLSLNLFPLIPLDVWEHAYYLKYKNRRSDYIDKWLNIINWECVEKRFENFLKNRKF